MKTRFKLLMATLLMTTLVFGQPHITIDDPDTWSGESLREYVGKTVIFDVPMVVCANANGSYVVSPWRRMQPESCGVVGSDEYRSVVRINSSCMFSISNINGYHRCGEKIIGLKAKVNSTGSLSWEGGTWSGNTRAELEAGIPDLGDYRLLVCGFNLENYYMTLGSMGARTESDRAIQREKISKALKRINADIYGLVELQQGDEAIGEITGDLNNNLPNRNYKFFHDASSGTSQASGFVYDANKVQPIGTPVETDVELKFRKKMICFREIATGEKFIYSINHFKSMNTGGEETRVNEARAVISLYNTYRQNGSVREKDVLFMGDLNCYAYTRPIEVFTNNGYIDLHHAFHADSSYSYMFGGMASYIDHAISNETLFRQITGMAGYHINSDEDDYYTYDKSGNRSMFRCSDHDPVVVGLKLDSTLSGTPYFNDNNFAKDSLTFYYSYALGEENVDPQIYFDIYTINGYRICGPKHIDFNNIIPQNRTKYYTVDSTNPNLPEELKQFFPLQAGIYILRFYYNGNIFTHKLIVR